MVEQSSSKRYVEGSSPSSPEDIQMHDKYKLRLMGDGSVVNLDTFHSI